MGVSAHDDLTRQVLTDIGSARVRDGENAGDRKRQPDFRPPLDASAWFPLSFRANGRTENDVTIIPTTVAIIAIAALGAGSIGALVSLVIAINHLVMDYHSGHFGF